MTTAEAAVSSNGSQPSSSSSSSNNWQDPMQQLLQAYLRANESAAVVGELGFLRSAVADAESPAAPGCSFPALLGVLVGLGCCSPRQIHNAAMDVERQRWGRLRLPPLGPPSPPVKAALAAAELADFHRQLAGPGQREADTTTTTTTSSSSSGEEKSWQQQQVGVVRAARSPLMSASASFEEGPQGVVTWGPEAWRAGEPRRATWRWRGALTGDRRGGAVQRGSGD
jgi:hypothetical protein